MAAAGRAGLTADDKIAGAVIIDVNTPYFDTIIARIQIIANGRHATDCG